MYMRLRNIFIYFYFTVIVLWLVKQLLCDSNGSCGCHGEVKVALI